MYVCTYIPIYIYIAIYLYDIYIHVYLYICISMDIHTQAMARMRRAAQRHVLPQTLDAQKAREARQLAKAGVSRADLRQA